jgi:hypothetical protein
MLLTLAVMAKCAGITQAGTACKGIPIDGYGYCYTHHPDHIEERRRHGSKGGKRGGRGRPAVEVSEIKKRLSDLTDDTFEGAIDTRVAAVTSQILNVLLQAVTVELQVREQLELEQRLEELEAALDHGSCYGA